MLYIQLLESMSLIGLSAYLYSQTKTFKNLIKYKFDKKNKIIMIVFFSLLSIIGTYTGVDVQSSALANTRPIGSIVAGYIGGPVIGVIVGAIAGTHRYLMGGYTAVACAVSTIGEGFIGGIFGLKHKNNDFSIIRGIIAGVVAELFQMIIILGLSTPYKDALRLEQIIALPMIIINSIGVGIFINIIKNTKKQYELNELAKEASKAEIKALRAQIHPHFLFNALNTIASFCRINPSKARELILNLSNYFRQTLNRQEDFIGLKDEIEFLKSYLAIEKARFEERLRIHIDIEDNMMNIKMPVFILQPLIENSIKHGILEKESGGDVFIRVLDRKEKVLFEVEDNGVGMTKERLMFVLKNWPGIGLSNVNKRLKLLYGKECEFQISSRVNKGTIIKFTIPKEVF